MEKDLGTATNFPDLDREMKAVKALWKKVKPS